MLVYKILLPAEWDRFQADGGFAGSPLDRADHFVHCSTRAQVGPTARAHFAPGQELVVVALDASTLGGALRWEAAADGGAPFPHVHGILSGEAVRGVHRAAGPEQVEPALARADQDLVVALERELQDPLCRADEFRMRELIAPDVLEVGASGRRWDLEGILAMLREEAGDPDRPEIGMGEVTARTLGPDLIQVLWDSTVAGRRARRSSLWRREGGRWQLVFHQGTPLGGAG